VLCERLAGAVRLKAATSAVKTAPAQPQFAYVRGSSGCQGRRGGNESGSGRLNAQAAAAAAAGSKGDVKAGAEAEAEQEQQ
jgi:hypothetical protein